VVDKMHKIEIAKTCTTMSDFWLGTNGGEATVNHPLWNVVENRFRKIKCHQFDQFEAVVDCSETK